VKKDYMLTFVLFLVLGYLSGSIPFGFIIPKIKGIDIRKIGSKGTTATNVARALGWRWGILVALLDILKAIIPTYLAARPYITNPWQVSLIALTPTVGHIFPVWLNFKGGRGASTFFGASLVLVGPKFLILSFVIWITILILFKIVSLTNLLFAWIFSLLLLVFFPWYFIYGILGSSLITLALRENIQRLKKGEEPKISLKW